MDQVKNALIIIEAALALLLTVGVLVQTPKASGLGGTIGGGDGGLGGEIVQVLASRPITFC